MVVALNRGKKSVLLDAHSPRGREAIYRLAAKVDAFVTNFREDALVRMGLDYETIRKINPAIVYASGTGFGRNGPVANKAMVDGVGQARGGINSVNGFPGEVPLPVGAIIADMAGGLQMALAVTSGLLGKIRYGIGQRVESSSYGGQLWLQMWEIAHSSMTGHIHSRQGNHHPDFPSGYGIYGTSDGRSVFYGFSMDEPTWSALWAFAGMPDVANDERWSDLRKRNGMDSPAQAEIAKAQRPLLVEAFKRRTYADWCDFFETQPEMLAHGIFGYEDILEDPQALENGYIVDMDLPLIGTKRVVGNLIAMSETPGSVKGPPAEQGQHTEEVLTDLGYSWEEIEAINAETREALRKKFAALGIDIDKR
jgi:crotonobetainyl-CoA:carnitine CoA-transferase CaiB-like acyl-CoA transferase